MKNKTIGSSILDIAKKQSSLLILAAILVFAIFFEDGNFWQIGNITNVLRLVGIFGVLALGKMFVVIGGGYDFSLGSTYALAGIIAAYLQRFGVVGMLLGPIAAGALIGFLNGTLVSRLRLAPFVATIATSLLFRGIAYVSTPGALSMMIDSEAFSELGNGALFGIIPYTFIIFIVFAVISEIFLRHTVLGRHIFAIGGNYEAATMVGVKSEFVKTISYTLCGAFAGFAGALLAARAGSGTPTVGTTILLNVVAAIVLGGMSLKGGDGSVTKVIIGSFIMKIIENLVNLNGKLQYYDIDVITATVVLLVIVVQAVIVIREDNKKKGSEKLDNKLRGKNA